MEGKRRWRGAVAWLMLCLVLVIAGVGVVGVSRHSASGAATRVGATNHRSVPWASTNRHRERSAPAGELGSRPEDPADAPPVAPWTTWRRLLLCSLDGDIAGAGAIYVRDAPEGYQPKDTAATIRDGAMNAFVFAPSGSGTLVVHGVVEAELEWGWDAPAEEYWCDVTSVLRYDATLRVRVAGANGPFRVRTSEGDFVREGTAPQDIRLPAVGVLLSVAEWVGGRVCESPEVAVKLLSNHVTVVELEIAGEPACRPATSDEEQEAADDRADWEDLCALAYVACPPREL